MYVSSEQLLPIHLHAYHIMLTLFGRIMNIHVKVFSIKNIKQMETHCLPLNANWEKTRPLIEITFPQDLKFHLVCSMSNQYFQSFLSKI